MITASTGTNNNMDDIDNNNINSNATVDEYYLRQQNRTHNHSNFLSPQQYDELLLGQVQNNQDQQQHVQETVTEQDNNNSKNQNNKNEQQEQSRKQENDDDNEEQVSSSSSYYTFVVVADTQLGMIEDDEQWDNEILNCTKVIQQINTISPPPLFCCICGDLVNMTYSIYTNKMKPSWATTTTTTTSDTNSNAKNNNSIWTKDECNTIRTKQLNDFKLLWQQLNKNIALVCICGNHDVGNIPTTESIQQYTSEFGNDYLSFWVNTSNNNITKTNNTTNTNTDDNTSSTGTIVPSSTSSILTSINNPLSTYCIVFNSSLFNDPSQCCQYYKEQLIWIEQQLQYATRNNAKFLFLFCHHPLFVDNENENDNDEDCPGSYYSTYRTIYTISDTYFHIPKIRRTILLNLCKQYNVNAIFCGHFHQNMILTTSFHMKLIITAPTSLLLYSNNPTIQNHYEPKSLGYRLITVSSSSCPTKDTTNDNNNKQSQQFQHEFISIE